MPWVAENAATFVSSLGINAHLDWTSSPYSQLSQVEAATRYLGLQLIRTSLNAASVGAVSQAAASGFHFDLGSTDLTGMLPLLHSLAQSHPGAIAAIEGPNEVDGFPITFDGLTSYAGAAAFQKALWAAVHADPLLAATPVYNLTVSGLTAALYQALGDLSAYATDANLHIYYAAGQPLYGANSGDPTYAWSQWLAAGQIDAPNRPTVITETGSTTATGGVDETVQAKQILNSLMDAAHSGVAATYLYELVDSQPDPTGADPAAHYGLFHADWTPKLAATALHNLTVILSDSALNTSTSAALLDGTLSGLPASGQAQLLQQGDGVLDLVIWAEPRIWNSATGSEVAAPATTVTLTLAHSAVAYVYDPLQSATPIATFGVTQQVAVSVSDHPVIIELQPSIAAPALSAAPPLVTPAASMAVGQSLASAAAPSPTTGAAFADPTALSHQPASLSALMSTLYHDLAAAGLFV